MQGLSRWIIRLYYRVCELRYCWRSHSRRVLRIAHHIGSSVTDNAALPVVYRFVRDRWQLGVSRSAPVCHVLALAGEGANPILGAGDGDSGSGY